MNTQTDAGFRSRRQPRAQLWVAPRLDRGTDGISLVLHAIAVLAVVASMRRVDDADRLLILGPLAVGGLLFGYLMSRTRVQDFVAHSMALWVGAAASLITVVMTQTPTEELISARGRPFFYLLEGVWQSIFAERNQTVANDELLVVLGITAWLLAYCSSWVVYRRGWYFAGLAMPAAILLISIRLDGRSGGVPLAFFVVAAIALGARHAISIRSLRWSAYQIPVVRGLPLRFVMAGLPVAVAAVVAASLLTSMTHENLSQDYRSQIESQWQSMQDQLGDLVGGGRGSGSYASFPDSFDIGGDIDLGDEIVARVTSDEPHYLALRRYDVYDGRGWSSDVRSTFLMDGDGENAQVTNVIFGKEQTVALSGNVSLERLPQSAMITVVRPKDDLVFTIETFSSASEQVFAVLGWEQLPEKRFDVNEVSLSSVPVDLQSLVRSIREAPFSVDPDSGDIVLTDKESEATFNLALDRLAAYPVDARLEQGDAGQLILVVTGRIPNYDDIEALFASESIRPGASYGVTGLGSTASPDELASATTDYPVWIANRYLQLPDGITERTKAEAQRIVIQDDASNPFDEVWAIQQYLRENFTYELNGPAPDAGQDWVDFFLFDHQAGRCEQFATSMAVMLRSLGIPARIVSGYNSSGESELIGEMIYRENQAHTWVEAFFPGYGWVPFEPTTNQEPFTYWSEDSDPTGGENPEPSPEASPIATEEQTETESTPEPIASPEPNAGVTGANDRSTTNTIIGVGLAVAIAAVIAAGLWMFVAWRVNFRGLAPASALYARALKVGQWFGVNSNAATTPNEFARAFGRTLPGSQSAIRSITNAYYFERFGPIEAQAAGISEAETGWKQLRRSILRWRIRRRNWGR